MSTFATWAVIIWAAPFVWFCILAAAAYVCEVCVTTGIASKKLSHVAVLRRVSWAPMLGIVKMWKI